MNNATVGEFLPSYINSAVLGSFALFTAFGLTQLALQTLTFGPSLYWVGELAYVVLSAVAKANLGFTVLREVLVEGAPSTAGGFEAAA